MAKSTRNYHGINIFLIILLDFAIIRISDGFSLKKLASVRLPRNSEKSGPVPSCKNSTFCLDTPYYPSDYVESILSMNAGLKYLATNDVPTGISERMDESIDGETLCESEEAVVRPLTALSIDRGWLYIANTPEFVQSVRVEICQGGRNTCKIIDSMTDGYQTACKQTYIYRQMVAINAHGGVSREWFKIPASCKCFVRFTGETRMLVDQKNRTRNGPTIKKPFD